MYPTQAMMDHLHTDGKYRANRTDFFSRSFNESGILKHRMKSELIHIQYQYTYSYKYTYVYNFTK